MICLAVEFKRTRSEWTAKRMGGSLSAQTCHCF